MTPPAPTIQEKSFSALSQTRLTTDFEIPATWLLLPLASYFAWAVFAIVWWLGGFGLGRTPLGDLGVVYLDFRGFLGLIGILAMASSMGSSYVLYAIMTRINAHSAKTQILLSRTLGILGSRIGSQPSPAIFALNSAEVNMQGFVDMERERSAFLWALLAMIPFVGWIFVICAQWLVSRDLGSHTRLESIVLEDIDRTMKTVGLQGFQSSRAQSLPRNSLPLAAIVICFLEVFSSLVLGSGGALVLIYLTLGIISLIGVDLSTRDPRRHFQYHSKVEYDIVRMLAGTMGPNGGPT
jgi:hypothetical protein